MSTENVHNLTDNESNETREARAVKMLELLHPDLSRGSAVGDDQLLEDAKCLADLIEAASPKQGEVADDTIPNAAFMLYRILETMRQDRKDYGGGSHE